MKILRFSVQPTGADVLFINNEHYKKENSFDIYIKTITGRNFKPLSENENPQAPNPIINITFPCGNGETDLCSLKEAYNITVTSDPKWKADIKINPDEEDPYLLISLVPKKGVAEKDFSAIFQINKLITTAKPGMVTADISIKNFPDISNISETLSLSKYYPAHVNYFKSEPQKVDLNTDATLSWSVESARKCHISIEEIGDVESHQSIDFTVTKPHRLQMAVTDFKGENSFYYCAIDINKPIIEYFNVDSETFFKGEEVVLSWKVKSAYSLTITPKDYSGATLPLEGTLKVRPRGDTTYTLTVYGYDGQNYDYAIGSVRIREWGWKMIGQAKLPDKDDVTKFNDVIYEYNRVPFLYSNKKIYEYKRSDNSNPEWHEKKTEKFPSEATLEGYVTMFDGKILYILGGKNGNEENSLMVTYNFENDKWGVGAGMPPNILYSSACSFVLNKVQYICHANLVNDRAFLIAFLKRTGWSADILVDLLDMKEKVSSADAVRIAFWRDKLYAAVSGKRDGKGIVQIWYKEADGDRFKEWKNAGDIDHNHGEWFYLLPCRNDLYLINTKGIHKSPDWNAAVDLFPAGDVIYAGVTDERACIVVKKETAGNAEVWNFI